MKDITHKAPRLFVPKPFVAGQSLALSGEQSHYLVSVRRLQTTDPIRIFNGQQGEWLGYLDPAHRKQSIVKLDAPLLPQQNTPDLWLLYAPIKNRATQSMLEKAVELGCQKIQPVFTQNTNAERVRREKLQDYVIGAAQQCGALAVPEIGDTIKLKARLSDWPSDRQIAFADESGQGLPPKQAFAKTAQTPEKWALLIGPEGGFTHEEAETLRALPFVTSLSLGPRILRADTAAIAALSLWQSFLGDWQQESQS